MKYISYLDYALLFLNYDLVLDCTIYFTKYALLISFVLRFKNEVRSAKLFQYFLLRFETFFWIVILGHFCCSVAWLIGWALILEYTIGGSAVARGISPNLVQCILSKVLTL